MQFTFQSGDIQITRKAMKQDWDINLHSNLVIFKYILAQNTRKINTKFTFQSGDIQIYENKAIADRDILFTFQSGDIQIHFFNLCKCIIVEIYIPIW